MKVVLTTRYAMAGDFEIELPEGKTWDDVKHWGVKWCVLYLTFKDGTELEKDVSEFDEDATDFKYPDLAKIRPVDVEHGGPDWNAVPFDEQASDVAISEAEELLAKHSNLIGVGELITEHLAAKAAWLAKLKAEKKATRTTGARLGGRRHPEEER